MKTITIGRGDGCQIFIDDDLISRRHAILKISTFGKMEIVDMGKNGTFVNGIRLRPNVPVPVKRKDIISFANVSQLDWKQVPNPGIYYKWGIIGTISLILILILINLGIWAYNSLNKESNYEQDEGNVFTEQTISNDSTTTNPKDSDAKQNDNVGSDSQNDESYDFGPDEFDKAAKKQREAEIRRQREAAAAKAKQKEQEKNSGKKQQKEQPKQQQKEQPKQKQDQQPKQKQSNNQNKTVVI